MKNLNPQIMPNIHSNWLINQPNMPKRLSKIKAQDEIRIVYFGTPDFSGFVLEKLIEFCQNPPQTLEVHLGGGERRKPKFIIQTVVTAPDKAVGRKSKVTPSSVALVAEKYGIPTLKPLQLHEGFIKTHLSFLDADLFVVAAYGKILPQKLLEIPTFGALNIHPSLLPKYRGASPIQQAILNGDEISGISIIKMDEEMDHGPIVYQEEFKLSDEDTFDSLSKKMFARAAEVLPSVIQDYISGKIKPRVQIHARATFCTPIKKQDGYFEINNPPSSEKLDRMIRAYYPWPTVWTRWKGKIVKFLPAVIPDDLRSGIQKVDSRVRGNDRKYLIQMEGKKAVPFKDFLNGYPNFPKIFM